MAHRSRGGSTGSDESSSDEDDRKGRMMRSAVSTIKRSSPKKIADGTPPRSRSRSRESGERSGTESDGDQRKHKARSPSSSPPAKRKKSRTKSPDDEKQRDSREKSRSPGRDRRKRDRSRDRNRSREDNNYHRDQSGHKDRDYRNRYSDRRDENRYSDRYDRKDRYRDREDRHRDRREDRESRKRRYDDTEDGDDRKGRGRRRSPLGEEEDKENKRGGSRSGREKGSSSENAPTKDGDTVQDAPPVKKSKEDMLNTKTGGAYIPPARLRMMQAQITDKSSEQYQRISWEALKKSLNGLINKVNVSNISDIVRELFQENIVRGRGLLTRSMIQAQAASPTFTHVYAALVAIINTKFPNIGELILKRLIIQFKRGFRRNDKNICLTATRFIAHLVNQQVAHEVVALEVLTLLLENPTDDSVEVAINFLKESGQKLTEVSPRGIHAIFERLRNVLHEGSIDKRTQYMIEVMFAVRKDGFKDHPAVPEELDLVEEDDQFTHLTMLDEAVNGEEMLNVFKNDPEYLENEEKYKTIKKGILDESSSDEEGGSGSGSSSDDDSDDEEDEEEAEKQQLIIDQTETNMIAFRRTVYLTLQSSLDFEECAHKLLKMEIKPGYEKELCNMILDCCAQLRTYEKFYGLLAQRFCMLDRKYIEPYQEIFEEQYTAIHRLETNKLRNVAKFFAHLLFTDAIPWIVLQSIKLNEDDTTSSSRIFIKILFQELCEYMGLAKLNGRLKDPTLQEFFEGLFPRENPRNARFAINFFTSIGLGGLTDELREHLKTMPKVSMLQQPQQADVPAGGEESSSSSSSGSSSSSSDSSSGDSSSDDSSSDSSDDEDSSSSSSSSDSSDSESEEAKKRKKKKTSKTATKDKVPEERKKRKKEIEQPKQGKNRDDFENGQRKKRDRNTDEDKEGKGKKERNREERIRNEYERDERIQNQREEKGERSSSRRRQEENGDGDGHHRTRHNDEETDRGRHRNGKDKKSVERSPRNERRRADRYDGENEHRNERPSDRKKERDQNRYNDRDSVDSDDYERVQSKVRTKEREHSKHGKGEENARQERRGHERRRRSESDDDSRSRRRR